MKKIYSILLLSIFSFGIKAASYTVTISGTSYSPNTLTVSVGDVVTIQASVAHPLAQVDQTTWNANGTATLSTGWGIKTSNYTFTVSSTNTIYYVCTAHVTLGMKGQIIVSTAGVNENALPIGNVSLYPNPAKNNLHVNFTISTATAVSVKIYDITGREIERLMNETNLQQGSYNYQFDLPSSLNAGNYFVEMATGNQKLTKKLIVTQ